MFFGAFTTARWNALLLRSCLGAARRALHCRYRSPSLAGASARRGVTAPTRMHGSAKPSHARVPVSSGSQCAK
jgi:hypothetical protein